jgi:hypothetical protein
VPHVARAAVKALAELIVIPSPGNKPDFMRAADLHVKLEAMLVEFETRVRPETIANGLVAK